MEHDLTARSGDDEIEVKNPDGPDATALTELGGNEPATTALAKENITRTVREENVENVCIPSRPQAQLAEDYKIDSPKSYSSDRQEDTSALLENDESMSDNVMTEADFIQCAGQLGSLITHITLMKQNMMKCTVASPEAFLVDAKEAAQSCKKIAARLEKV